MREKFVIGAISAGQSITAVETFHVNPNIWTVLIIPIVTGVLIPWLKKKLLKPEPKA
jgi:hypothetical protein